MANDNPVSATLPEQDAQEIIASLGAVRAKLPFLVTLSTQERRLMAKMGRKSIGFDEKCTAYMQSNPEFLPGFVPRSEVDKDRSLRTQILRFAAELQSLAQQVDDTLLAVSSDIWQADLAYYRNVRMAARGAHPGAKMIADDLAGRFATQGRTRVTGVAPATPSPVTQLA
jgi:hypothetical protein